MIQKAVTRVFTKEFLKNVVWGDTDVEIADERIIEQRRWAVLYEMVFKYEGKYYRIHYDRPATEMQDVGLFECEPDNIEVTQVEKVEVVTHQWRPVGEKSDANQAHEG